MIRAHDAGRDEAKRFHAQFWRLARHHVDVDQETGSLHPNARL